MLSFRMKKMFFVVACHLNINESLIRQSLCSRPKSLISCIRPRWTLSRNDWQTLWKTQIQQSQHSREPGMDWIKRLIYYARSTRELRCRTGLDVCVFLFSPSKSHGHCNREVLHCRQWFPPWPPWRNTKKQRERENQNRQVLFSNHSLCEPQKRKLSFRDPQSVWE